MVPMTALDSDSRYVRTLMAALNWLYSKVVPETRKAASLPLNCGEQEIDQLITSAAIQAGLIGFASNAGGLITIPVTLPANIASVYAIQLRLIGKIALARGYDTSSRDVQTAAVACLVGGAAVKLLKDAGVQLTIKVAQSVVNQVAGATLIQINRAVGFRLVTKAGTHGVVNLGRIVPILGGVVGGSFDVVTTRLIGRAAKQVFVPVQPVAGRLEENDLSTLLDGPFLSIDLV